MTPTEALARIAAHCDELETDAHPGRLVAQVRAVLAEVTPEPVGTLDRDQAREVLWKFRSSALPNAGIGPALDALAACVRPATVDRDALLQAVHSMRHSRGIYDTEMADRILALVRPVAGVVLSREEAARIVHWYTLLPIGVSADNVELAGRLKEVAAP